VKFGHTVFESGQTDRQTYIHADHNAVLPTHTGGKLITNTNKYLVCLLLNGFWEEALTEKCCEATINEEKPWRLLEWGSVHLS